MNIVTALDVGTQSSSSHIVSIIPLTIVNVLQWMDPVDNEFFPTSTTILFDTQPTDSEQKLQQSMVGVIRRLEPVESLLGFVADTVAGNMIEYNNNGGTPLHWAAHYGNDKCMPWLLSVEPFMATTI
eukprot:PhF_6_TR423/c1_g1_i2/m.139